MEFYESLYGRFTENNTNELATYNLDLVAVKEVRFVEVCSQPADDYTFLYGNGNA
jgi:hypothetical protein